MPTLLLRLEGPMQSWGTRSRFDRRDTGDEPSKSGVLGLLCAAMGIDRTDAEGLEPLIPLRMGVRVDRPGLLQVEFQTAQLRPGRGHESALAWLEYLADASFLVGLEGEDRDLLRRAHESLDRPHWLLCLGRRAYAPSQSVFIPDGLRDQPLETALREGPWSTTTRPDAVDLILESSDGSPRRDVPTGAFAERRFTTRYVQTATVAVEAHG